ncbi:MAG: single-stranded DNA-binding protein [Cryobacterium sp.]|nr:single-stranded DNA-binding protein [Cryobacterium sp.]
MTIPTQLSLHGFIATTPELTKPDQKDARFYARVGVEHWRKETDGSFTRLDPSFHNLVLYGESAKRAYARFRVGDQFVASGYITEYEKTWNEQTVTREQFVARHIGHDTTWTRYSVDRTPAARLEPPADHVTVAIEPARVVGL